MANANSVAGVTQNGTIRNTFPTQALAAIGPTVLTVNTDTGTAAFILPLPQGGVIGASPSLDVNANQAITTRGGREYGTPNGEAGPSFSTASWDGSPFVVRITGIGNAGANAAQSVLINLYQGTSTTVGSDNIIGATGAALATVAGGAFNFYIEATVMWDSTSQILSGAYEANIAFGATSQYTAKATGTKFVFTGVTAANLSFLASITLGNAAASSVTVTEFVIDKI